MGDVLPFFLLAVIVAAVWLVLTAVRGGKRSLPKDLPPIALEDPRKIREWYQLLHDYDEIMVTQMNDLNIKPFLPEDMQTQISQLHKRFRKSL